MAKNKTIKDEPLIVLRIEEQERNFLVVMLARYIEAAMIKGKLDAAGRALRLYGKVYGKVEKTLPKKKERVKA